MLFVLAHTLNTVATISPDQELAQVMGEITSALHGIGSVLTLHPTGRNAEVIYAEEGRGLVQIVTGMLANGSLDWHQEHFARHRWVACNSVGHAPYAFALPVRQLPGHSRLVITVFFDKLDDERRLAAEAAYLQRRPFAVGYFRLWQQERLHRRDVDALRAALDLVDIGVVLITKSGGVAFANDAARKLLDAGTALHEQNGMLRARSRSDNVTLGVLIAHVAEAADALDAADKTPLLTLKRDALSPLIVAVLAAPHPVTEQGEIAALVLAVDPDMEIREFAAPVCRAFGLSRVEAELACELASGRTLAEAAETMHVKLETARSYLKSVFLKTRTNRQTDLVRLILVSLVRASPL